MTELIFGQCEVKSVKYKKNTRQATQLPQGYPFHPPFQKCAQMHKVG